MPIDVTCPCTMKFRVKEELAGQRVRCPGCGKAVVVPVPPTAPVVVDEEKPPSDQPDAPSIGARIWRGVQRAATIPPRPGPPPDTRTVEERRHDALIGLLGSIYRRLGWMLVMLIVVAISSCSVMNTAFQQSNTFQRARY